MFLAKFPILRTFYENTPFLTSYIPWYRLHAWFEDAVDRGGVLGNERGAGLEAIAAGGMHTLAVDEDGKVSLQCHASNSR